MTNKYMYFIANWKMFGDLRSINSLNKVIKFFKIYKKKKFVKIIYCPPNTLIRAMSEKLYNSKIGVGAQNCHQNENAGAFCRTFGCFMEAGGEGLAPFFVMVIFCTAVFFSLPAVAVPFLGVFFFVLLAITYPSLAI